MPGESIYVPERHAEADPAYIHSFLDSYPFAMVVTTAGGLQVTNVPTLLDRPAAGETWGSIWWHLAKSNAQNLALGDGASATLIFHGPHAYISPNWYETRQAVPTWNFAVVHCTGRVSRVEDDAKLAAGLARLVAANESKYGGGAWEYAELPESYRKGMRQGIIGYEMKIGRVEAKFKLGQERIPEDRAGVLRALRAGKSQEKPLAALTEEYYARRK